MLARLTFRGPCQKRTRFLCAKEEGETPVFQGCVECVRWLFDSRVSSQRLLEYLLGKLPCLKLTLTKVRGPL